MNKRTPNRHGARSFGFLDRFCSFVQGLLEFSSFVRRTVLQGAREYEKVVYIMVVLPSTSCVNPGKPLLDPPTCLVAHR
jgi:hypothetical protein